MYATLPAKAKPSKTTSKPKDARPTLENGELTFINNQWVLSTIDSFRLVRLVLSVKDDNTTDALTPGVISQDALKAIEKSGGFRATETEIIPVTPQGVEVGLRFARNTVGKFPDTEQQLPELDGQEFTVGLNAKYLYEVAVALGAEKDNVQLTFVSGADKLPNNQRPIVVTATGNRGENKSVLMPIRVST